MPVAQPTRRLTEAEYLEQERRADFKSEFFAGEMFAMAGGTRAHSLIAVNLARELSTSLKGRPCVVFNTDLRIKIEATGLFTYPDASVGFGQQRFLDELADTLLNPAVIVEVLSDSTEAYDRGKKFEHYRQITTLREYLVISQKEARVELFSKGTDGQWSLREAAGLNATIQFPSLQVTIALAEIYANVEFVPSPIRAR